MPETTLPAGWVDIGLRKVHYHAEGQIRSLCGQISRNRDDPFEEHVNDDQCGSCRRIKAAADRKQPQLAP